MLGLLAMASLAIASSNLHLASSLQRTEKNAKIDLVRRNLVNLLLHETSWSQTRSGALNGSSLTNCATSSGSSGQQCTPSPWAGSSFCRVIPQLCQPNCSGGGGGNGPGSSNCPVGAASAQLLSVYDGSGRLYYNARNTRNGFTDTGLPCGPNAPAPYNTSNYPSNACPFRYDLRWYAVSNATSPNRPLLAIRATLQRDASYGSKINTIPYDIPVIYRLAQ